MIPLPFFHFFCHACALALFLRLLSWAGWTLISEPWIIVPFIVLLVEIAAIFALSPSIYPTPVRHRALFFAAPFMSYALFLSLIVLSHITAAPPAGLVPGSSYRVDLALSYFARDNSLKLASAMLVPFVLSIALPFWIPHFLSRAFWIRIKLFLNTWLTRALTSLAGLARRALAFRRFVHNATLSPRTALSFFKRSIDSWTQGLHALRTPLRRALKAPSGLARLAREQAAKHAFSDDMELSLNTRAELDRATPAEQTGPFQSSRRL